MRDPLSANLSGAAAAVLNRTAELAVILAPTGTEWERSTAPSAVHTAAAAAASLAALGPAALGQAGSRHSINIGATSTDANAAHAAGVPAVALGVTRGQGEHTPGEWIETGQVGTGLAVLADTITTFREAPL